MQCRNWKLRFNFWTATYFCWLSRNLQHCNQLKVPCMHDQCMPFILATSLVISFCVFFSFLFISSSFPLVSVVVPFVTRPSAMHVDNNNNNNTDYDCLDDSYYIYDVSDEMNCTSTCTSGQFRCSDGSCIWNYLKCDYTWHCPNGEDEANCSRKKTPTNYHKRAKSLS